MLGLSFANSKQALCCFMRLAASPKLSAAVVGCGWTADTVSSFAPSAGAGAVAGAAEGVAGAEAGVVAGAGGAAVAGAGDSGAAILPC